MKQHAIFFVVFGASYLIITGLKRNPSFKILISRIVFFSIGVTLPFAIICLHLYLSGLFDKFWFWTFTYAHEYVSEIPLKAGLIKFSFSSTREVMNPFLLLTLLAALGLLFTIFGERAGGTRLFVIPFLLSSFLAICPGSFFRVPIILYLHPSSNGITCRQIDSTNKGLFIEI